MTQKDKELLLKDLCARLPYGVIIHVNGHDERVDEINPFEGIITYGFQSFSIDECKPYLRPMSSMTEEECDEWAQLESDEWGLNSIDWLNCKMFDYRDLISKGLAIEVTRENNPYK